MREARVDVTGQTFVLQPASSSEPDLLSEETLRILGPESVRLEGEFAALETADSGQAALWLDSLSILQLSLLEARMLSGLWGSVAGRQAGLGFTASHRLVTALRFELAVEFERIHTAGGTSDRLWYKRRFPAAFRRAVDRLGPELESARAAVVLTSLQESAGE